jgi:hypothetical protein
MYIFEIKNMDICIFFIFYKKSYRGRRKRATLNCSRASELPKKHCKIKGIYMKLIKKEASYKFQLPCPKCSLLLLIKHGSSMKNIPTPVQDIYQSCTCMRM